MARKMTGRERDDAEALRGVLVQELGPADRGYAPGIASALVRLPDGRATADDVERILGKYKVSANALKKMKRAAPKKTTQHRKLYVCNGCGHEYDLLVGDPENDVKPGTAFKDLPEGWVCPHCGESADQFIEIEV